MIDNPYATVELLALMEDALPITAMIPPPLSKLLQEQSPELIVLHTAVIKAIEYHGDIGGIMCVLDVDARDDGEHVLLVSLTNLKIDGRHPLSRRIATYQKRRMKRIAEGRKLMTLRPPLIAHEYPSEDPVHGTQMHR